MLKEKSYIRSVAAFSCTLFSLITLSCAGFSPIRTSVTDESDISGTYTVILFGGNITNDPRTLAVLDREGDDYTFTPFAREDDYLVRTGFPSDKALAESRYFTGRYTYFMTHQLRKILAPDGTLIGYEMRPLYHIQKFGTADILNVNYRLREKEVLVSVDINRDIEDRIYKRDSYQ